MFLSAIQRILGHENRSTTEGTSTAWARRRKVTPKSESQTEILYISRLALFIECIVGYIRFAKNLYFLGGKHN
jgi:hypothetical protein